MATIGHVSGKSFNNEKSTSELMSQRLKATTADPIDGSISRWTGTVGALPAGNSNRGMKRGGVQCRTVSQEQLRGGGE
jgi:hypothetical protein